jgi:hypothetical protein
VTCGVVALRHENVVIFATLDGLVEWDGLTHELLLNLAETIKTGLKLKVVVAVALGNGGHDGDVVAFGADVVGRGDDGNVNVCPAMSVRCSRR